MENSKYETADFEFKDPLEAKENIVNSEYVNDSEIKDPLESKKEKKKKNRANSCVKDSETKDPSESKKKKKMAKSQYADVKDAEIKDTLESGLFIVVRLQCSNFARFCEANEFIKPNDENVLNLMNSCASSICKEMPDIILAYGFGKEYSFIFRKETDVYTRRASKLVSVIASLFTSSYRMNWPEFFPNKDIRLGASFEAEALCLKTTRDVQAYLAFKQRECDETNLTNTCFWKLVESGKSEREAQEILEKSEKGKGRIEKNEILFQQFGINYNDLPDMFRQGSCILKTTEVFQCAASDVQAKKYDNGVYSRRKIIIVHTENVASPTFLNGYPILSEELRTFNYHKLSSLIQVVLVNPIK